MKSSNGNSLENFYTQKTYGTQTGIPSTYPDFNHDNRSFNLFWVDLFSMLLITKIMLLSLFIFAALRIKPIRSVSTLTISSFLCTTDKRHRATELEFFPTRTIPTLGKCSGRNVTNNVYILKSNSIPIKALHFLLHRSNTSTIRSNEHSA